VSEATNAAEQTKKVESETENKSRLAKNTLSKATNIAEQIENVAS
jgi:methyl-accepting chemotaxis protein